MLLPRAALWLVATIGMGCSAAPADHGLGGTLTHSGGSSNASSVGIGSGAAGPVIDIPTQAGAGSEVAAASDTWPSPACQGSPISGETGQYCQGPAFDPSAQTQTVRNESGCGTTLWGIARDFVGYAQTATQPPGMSHPDFGSHYCCGNPQGTVLSNLGADGKPIYNPANIPGDYATGVGLTGPEAFDQWYRDVPGVNVAYLVGFHLEPSADGVTRVYSSKLYFPVDNVGFGNFEDRGEDGQIHNFGFTTELHTKFKYQGGEVFAFAGDDDLWVYIDKQLAIDLGGIHTAMQGEIRLDELAAKAGLVVGQVYALDLFNAERHPSGSNFKITTSMTFVDCGVDPVVR